MGLDSVELLVSFEEYFSIEIPNLEAERINTVKNMVDSVAAHKGIVEESHKLKMDIEILFRQFLNLSETDAIFNLYHPSDESFWTDLEKKTDLRIPLPTWKHDATNTGISRIFHWMKWKPDYDWKEINFDRFCEVSCFANYEKLIEPILIKSKYEIYVAIAGITAEKTGVDFYEIFPQKTFVSDFGID